MIEDGVAHPWELSLVSDPYPPGHGPRRTRPAVRGTSTFRRRALIAAASIMALAIVPLTMVLVSSDAADRSDSDPPTGSTTPAESPRDDPPQLTGSALRAVADATVEAANPNQSEGRSTTLRSGVWPE